MTRVPPIVLPVGALLALVVALIGLALGWAQLTPVAFFVFIFCTILATIHISLATTEQYVPPAVEAVPNAAVYDASEEQDGGVGAAPRHMEEIPVPHKDASQPDVVDDEHPQRST